MRGFKAIVLAMVSALTGAGPAFAQSAPAVILQVKDAAELAQKFCVANPNVETIVVMPASLFVDSQALDCPSGTYKLYRIAKSDDPDDFIYFLDPPLHAHSVTLGCDGKAGKNMQTVAINCRPCPPLINK